MRSDCTRCKGAGEVINPAWLVIMAHVDDPESLTNEQLAAAFVEHGYSRDVVVIAHDGKLAWGLPPVLVPCPVCDGSEVDGGYEHINWERWPELPAQETMV